MAFQGLNSSFTQQSQRGNIIKNLIMDCQSYTKYRPNETTGGTLWIMLVNQNERPHNGGRWSLLTPPASSQRTGDPTGKDGENLWLNTKSITVLTAYGTSRPSGQTGRRLHFFGKKQRWIEPPSRAPLFGSPAGRRCQKKYFQYKDWKFPA